MISSLGNEVGRDWGVFFGKAVDVEASELLKYLIVGVSSLWLCDTNSSKCLVTTSRLTFLVLYHLNSVISVVRGP